MSTLAVNTGTNTIFTNIPLKLYKETFTYVYSEWIIHLSFWMHSCSPLFKIY